MSTGMRRPIRSSRPIRCSTTDGFHGRSNSTSRRQNSKLRPSPPASVETSRLGPLGLSEPRDLRVAARRRQLLVEDAARELRAVAERRAQHLQRLSVRHEDQRLLPRVAPAWCLRQQPLEARIAGVHRVGLLAQLALVGSEHGAERRSGRQRAADAIDLLSLARPRVAPPRLAAAPRRRCAPATSPASSSAIGMPTRGGKPPMSARRVELVHGGSGVPLRETRLETHVLGKLLRTQQLQQPEEPVGVVFERRGAEEQDVAAQGRDRRDRPPGRFAGMTRRAAKSLRFVHHQQIDPRADGLVGQLRSFDQHLERDHAPAMDVERVEVGAEVACDVGEAGCVEQREHLVVLPPQLAQPLHRQRIRRDHEAALDLSRVHEPIQDERGLDRLAEADLVCEQPAHRIGGRRALRDVELVRKEPHASAEKRAEAVGFAKVQEMQDVEARHEIVDLVEIAKREAFEQRAFELQRPQGVGGHDVTVREPQRPVGKPRRNRRLLSRRGDAHGPAPGSGQPG